jgi:hypothetical protein
MAAFLINARDFSSDVAAFDRDVWSAPVMEAVITALDGRAVAITTDPREGRTILGATLHYTVSGSLLVTSEDMDMPTEGVYFPLESIGMVLPIEGEGTDDTKSAALEIFRARRAAALAAAAEFISNRYGRNHGRLRAVPMRAENGFGVTYYPLEDAPEGAFAGSKVSVQMKEDQGAWVCAAVTGDAAQRDR